MQPTITLDNLLNYRMALEQIKDPSARILAAIAHLDECIALTICSFQTTNPTQGNA